MAGFDPSSLYQQPWKGVPYPAPDPAGQQAFPGTDNNRQSGASRQIGEFGGYPVGQVDVRTPFMQALEQWAAPLLMQTLTNPASLVSQFGEAGGAVPGAPTGGLGNFLFNDAGAFTPGGPPSGPPGGPPGSQPPAQPPQGPPVPPPPAQPWTNKPPVQPPTTPGANMFGNVNLDELNALLGGGGYGVSVRDPKQVQQSQLAGRFQQPEYWSGFQGAYNTPTLFRDTQGLLDPIYSFANPEQLMDYFTNPGGITGSASNYTFARQPGTSISPNEWQAWVDAFKAQGGQTRAQGGLLDPNAPTLVGEQGPELITPAGAGGQQMVQPLNTMVNAGSFPAAANQGQGTGSIQRLLEQNPEQQTFDISRNLLMGQGGILGSGSGGQGILNALQPMFQQNLKFGLNELTNRVPSVMNSAAAIEGADVTSRALNDYNLLAAQALQQGQQNTLGGLGLLGQLAGQAGQGQFGRNLAAGQLATQRDLGYGNLNLAAQQQQWNQTVNPTLQLLLAALGMATPTAFQTVVPGKK